MHQETNYTAIVLKKQPINEADEIITVYSLEGGKIRALAKSVKLPKSKLQNILQSGFEVKLELVQGKNLKTIIGGQVLNAFRGFREDLEKFKNASVALEMLLKLTPDEQPNGEVYENLKIFFMALEQPINVVPALLKYKIIFLKALGLNPLKDQYLLARKNLLLIAQHLEVAEYGQWSNLDNNHLVLDLQTWLTTFISYNLDREIKSDKFVV